MSANGVTCAEFGELAPELALGILSGNERAIALGHLAACAACRDQLDDLARVADNLLLLGPTREPPIGFESRVVARLQQEGGDAGQGQARQLRPRRRRTTPYRLLALAAAAAIVVVAVTVGLLEVNGAGSAKAVASVSKVVWAGKSTCQLVAFAPTAPGGPTVVMVRLNEVPADSNGSYPVFVEPVSGGAAVQVGMVPVRNGVGMRGFTVASTIGKIKAVVVRDSETPAILYRAAFAPI
jgi:anti-sigma-K factor RskA